MVMFNSNDKKYPYLSEHGLDIKYRYHAQNGIHVRDIYDPYTIICILNHSGNAILQVKVLTSDYYKKRGLYKLFDSFYVSNVEEYIHHLNSLINAWMFLKDDLLSFCDIDELGDFGHYSAGYNSICIGNDGTYTFPVSKELSKLICKYIYSINYIEYRYLVERLIDEIDEAIEEVHKYEQEIAKSKN